MTSLKWIAVVAGLVAAVGLGVWIGPHITHRTAGAEQPAAAATQPASDVEQARPAATATHVPRRAAASHARTSETTTAPSVVTSSKPVPEGATQRTVPAVAPALHEYLKPLLNKGTDMTLASDGFDDAEQFAAVAHAAQNTKVPFVLPKA